MTSRNKLWLAIYITTLCFICLMIVFLSDVPDSKRESATQIESGVLMIIGIIAGYYWGASSSIKHPSIETENKTTNDGATS